MKIDIQEFDSNEIEDVIHFLRKDAGFNGLIIDDLNDSGINLDYVRVFGEVENEEVQALLLIFKDKMFYTSEEDRDVHVFLENIKESHINKFVGRKHLIEKFKTFFDIEYESDSYIMQMEVLPFSMDNEDNNIVKKIQTTEEFDKLYNLLIQIDEYSYIGHDKDNFINNQMALWNSRETRTYYLEENGEMVSTAATLAEKANSAILVGVATPPLYRKKGYASKVVSKLSRDLINEGKTIYLFFNNPDAGSIYKRIGYQPVGEWKVMGIKNG